MKIYGGNYIRKLLVGGVMILCSCNEILSPGIKGQIALKDLVKTQSGIITVTNGIYSPLLALYNGGPMQLLSDLASDDGFTSRNAVVPDLFIATPTFPTSQSAWIDCYRGIANANVVISNIGSVRDFSSEAIKNDVKGQAMFMRGFYYFTLVRFFGGVPLIVHEVDSRDDAELPRSSIPDTYVQIKTDLDSAVELLPTAYNNSPGMETGRPTAYAANALLSLVYLELDQWDSVIVSADRVITTGKFHLLDNYADNFNGKSENGPGSLFEVQYSGAGPSTASKISHFYAPTNYQGGAFILPTDDSLHGGGGGPSSGNGFVQAFEKGDLRKNVIVSTYNLPNFIDPAKPDGSLYFVNKYYNPSEPESQSSWNFPLIRYAEILLAKAEALNEKKYIADGEAFDLLNKVRMKAGLTSLTGADLPDQAAFRQALRHERRIELAFECKRYFDLNRWGILDSIIQPQLDFLGLKFPRDKIIIHPITGKKYYLYPIPGTEFINNAKLGEQNPGYN